MNRLTGATGAAITDVFPTHVGMNRIVSTRGAVHVSIPHARGDEPVDGIYSHIKNSVFPTHVGMNRSESRSRTPASEYSPRTWG